MLSELLGRQPAERYVGDGSRNRGATIARIASARLTNQLAS
jgi:hypothetical protein